MLDVYTKKLIDIELKFINFLLAYTEDLIFVSCLTMSFLPVKGG